MERHSTGLRGSISLLGCLWVVITLSDGCLQAEEPSSLLPNFSFENWNAQTNAPIAWIYWSQNGDHTISMETDDPEHGSRSLRVWMPRYDMVQIQQYLSVQPQSKYRLSFVTRGAFLGSVAVSIEPNLAGLPIRNDTRWKFQEKWQKHSYEFDTKETVNSGVGIRFTGKGVVWLDNVLLEKLE